MKGVNGEIAAHRGKKSVGPKIIPETIFLFFQGKASREEFF